MIFKRAVAKLRAQDWVAITIELIIVILGVLIALAVQQWADNRSRRNKTDSTLSAVREELGEHYEYAVEYRVVFPCLRAQLDQLRERVLKSGATLDPAPLYRDGEFHIVIQQPSKAYATDAWQAAVSDGTTQRLTRPVRRALAGHYGQLHEFGDMSSLNNAAEQGFVALTHSMPLDPSVRFTLMQEIEQMRGRFEYLDFLNGQVLDYIQTIGMVPPVENAIRATKRYPTYAFCQAHGFPMRSFKDAMVPVPN